MDHSMHIHAKDRGLGPITWRSYLPLVYIIGVILLVTAIVSFYNFTHGLFYWEFPIALFMALFFVVFSIFKLMDLQSFAEGYATYDLLAGQVFAYGYVYPFIELFFGLAMLGMIFFDFPNFGRWFLWLEFILMGFSGLGVAIKLAKKEEFMCVCLGTFLKVPLTYVTLIEDFGMAALALTLLYF